MIRKVKIELPNVVGRRYDIMIGENILSALVAFIKKQDVSSVVIITDSNVKKLYGDKLLRDLKKKLTTCQGTLMPCGYNLRLTAFPAGEKNKNQKTKTKLEEEMLQMGCGRDTLIIALGGGVVGDVAGFVASTYMRGIPYINIPTTLLSMVDSSVGGKTAIDSKYGKNLIGAFHQPSLVLIDSIFLSTLPKRQIKNGLIEAIKMFLTNDSEMFNFVESNLSDILHLKKGLIEKVIVGSIKIKSEIIMRDEKEKGERAVLNFGHTIGHAIEKLSGYKLLHGEAIALGILVEAKVAQLIGKMPETVFGRIESLMREIVDIKKLRNFDIDGILKEAGLDKKVRGAEVRYVLLKDVGRYCKRGGEFVHVISDNIVKRAIKRIN